MMASEPVLTEAQRRAYLEAMGVTLYRARENLPGALPSVWEVLSPVPELSPTHADTADAAVRPAAQRVPPPSVSAQSVPSLKGQDALKLASASSPSIAAPTLPSGPASAEQGSLQFPVGFMVTEWSGRFRVLIQLQSGDAPSLSSEEHTLWQDIRWVLAGLREQPWETLPPLRCPPSVRLARLATAEALKDSVKSFLEGRKVRAGEARCLVFAEPAVREVVSSLSGLVILPSLAGMRGDPSLKREAWRLLKPLLDA